MRRLQNSLHILRCQYPCSKNPLQSELLVHKHLQSVAQHSSEHCAPHRVAGHPQHTHSEVFNYLPSQLINLNI